MLHGICVMSVIIDSRVHTLYFHYALYYLQLCCPTNMQYDNMPWFIHSTWNLVSVTFESQSKYCKSFYMFCPICIATLVLSLAHKHMAIYIKYGMSHTCMGIPYEYIVHDCLWLCIIKYRMVYLVYYGVLIFQVTSYDKVSFRAITKQLCDYAGGLIFKCQLINKFYCNSTYNYMIYIQLIGYAFSQLKWRNAHSYIMQLA